MSPRNLFKGDDEDPEEFTEGEDIPLQEIPVENLGGLFEDPPGDEAVEAIIATVKEGEVSINDARRLLGLPPVSDDITDTLRYLQGNAGFTTTETHLERIRDPDRWERG